MIAIAGGKGGCGKTTTTVGLVKDFSAAGRRVLAVDADRDMPDLHVLAGVPNDPTVGALASSAGNDPSEPPAVETVSRVIPGRPAAAVLPAAPGVNRDDLRVGLRRAREAPGITLVDCPAGAGPAAVDPIRIADRVLVVTTPAPASLRDAAKTAALARTVGTPVVGGVLTRSRGVPDGVERLLDATVVSVPHSDDPLSDPAVRRARERVVDRLE